VLWQKKIVGNRSRDERMNRLLHALGWNVVRLWECFLAKQPQMCVRRIQRALSGRYNRL
jgi:G:T-mismatch repair DNA endonuclease (very short patch repair protein)